MQTQKIAIVCQGSDKEPFTKETKYLFQSIDAYGGKLAKAKKIACFSESVSEETRTVLEKLGVEIRLIEPIDNRCVHANKIQMLGLSDLDFDILIALDTDTIILKDFSRFIDGKKIQAVQDDIDPLGLSNWKTLFKEFGLELPTERFRSSLTWEKTIPYFNTGVLLIPQQYVFSLYETWKSYIYKLLEIYKKFPLIAEHSFYTDQIAFSLAIQDKGFSYSPLSLEMNFPMHVRLHKNSNVEKINPFLIHYHHRISKSGNIRNCYYENINKCLDEIKFSIDRKNDSEILIDNLYMETLRRPADIEGLNHFSALLESKKMSLEDIRNIFHDSEEYKSLKNSDKICLGYEKIEKNDLSFFPFFDELDIEPLLKIINYSKQHFGWYSRHTPRLFEYPWFIRQIINPREKKILDIGTGITSLPIFLANEGAKIVTVDNNHTIRELNDEKSIWNEWGFFDYSKINKNISSYNSSIESINFQKEDFDYIYSVSVIEHLPKSSRKILWEKINYWLKIDGTLLLTIDLMKDTDELYNIDEYQTIDSENHGTLDDIKKEFIQNGFKLESCDFNKKPFNDSSTYLAFLKLSKS